MSIYKFQIHTRHFHFFHDLSFLSVKFLIYLLNGQHIFEESPLLLPVYYCLESITVRFDDWLGSEIVVTSKILKL